MGFRFRCAISSICLTWTIACSPSVEPVAAGEAGAAATAEQRATIQHLVPAPDSTGAVPARFEWTPVEGADYYDFLVLTDIDVLVWRQSKLRQPFVAWPKDRELEPGTYFWMVAAVRNDRPIAESGRAAFVVRTP